MHSSDGNSKLTDSQIHRGNESPDRSAAGREPASGAEERIMELLRQVQSLERSVALGIPRLDRRLDAIEAEIALLRTQQVRSAAPPDSAAPLPDLAGLEEQIRGLERRFDHAFRLLRERSLLGRALIVTALVVLFILVLTR